MTKINDIRKSVRGGNSKRALSRVTKIARHHSATTGGDYFAFGKRWFDQLNWNTGGYHEIILRDGSVQLCYDPNVITNGIGNHNTGTYHICVVGNGSFTADQEKTWEARAKHWIKEFRLSVKDVLGHGEFSGASTACPGINMNNVRAKLRGEKTEAAAPQTGGTQVTAPPKPTPAKPSTNSGTLRKGSKGKDVKALQDQLLSLGYKLPKFGADSDFGDETDKAVRTFQRDQGIGVDGIAGPQTFSKLAAAIKSKNQASTKPKKEYVSLPASAATWRTYRTNVQPVAKNSDWSLTPKAFGGLEYEIIGKPQKDVVTIKTSRGNRNIFVASSTGAKIFRK